MKDGLEFAIYIIVIAATFTLGMVVGISRIQSNCDKLSSFYIDNKVYECKIK